VPDQVAVGAVLRESVERRAFLLLRRGFVAAVPRRPRGRNRRGASREGCWGGRGGEPSRSRTDFAGRLHRDCLPRSLALHGTAADAPGHAKDDDAPHPPLVRSHVALLPVLALHEMRPTVPGLQRAGPWRRPSGRRGEWVAVL